MTLQPNETLDDFDYNLDIVALRDLERQMYLAGDSRSDIIRSVLDLMSAHGVIDNEYKVPDTVYAQGTQAH